MDVEEYLQYYSVGRLISADIMSVGSANKTYKIKTDLGEYILRVYSGEREENDILFEHEILQTLARSDFFSPKPVMSKENKTLLKKDHYFAVFEYIPGHSINTMEISADHVHSVGETLGWFHVLLQNYNPHYVKPSEDLIGTINLLKKNEDALKASSYPEINNIILELNKVLSQMSFSKDLPQGIVHSDLHERNILFQGGDVSGVLDFDNSYHGILLIDVATQIAWWSFRERKFQPILCEGFLRGYQSQRPLTQPEKDNLWQALNFSIIKLIIRSLCHVYLEGVKYETYNESSEKINAGYFQEMLRDTIEREDLIKKTLLLE